MLRERTGGTLERLMSMPVAKLDLLAGYGVAFAAVAAAQAGITAAGAFLALGVDVGGSAAAVVGLAIGNAVLGMSLGLFVSAFAATESRGSSSCPPSCSGRGWLDVAVIVGVTLLALALGAATLRRRTP